MTSISLIQQVVNDILKKMYCESKHGHILHYKDKNMSNDNDNNLEFISIKRFFDDKNYIEKTDWKWGLNKEEIEFVNEYWEYFNHRKMVSKYV
jgi:hypothetical protein